MATKEQSMGQRWSVRTCSRRIDDTWTQTWWTTNPIDHNGDSAAAWSDFPTWRNTLAYIRGQLLGEPDGLPHDNECWCYGCRTARGE